MNASNKGKNEQMIFEEIMLHNPPPLRIEHARIAIQDVEFDLNNPRFKYQRALFPDKTPHQLLFAHKDTNWLMRDIAEKGVLDPIYVRARSSGSHSYIVVEGNRRTACIKQLHQDHPDNPNYERVPARILPAETTDEQEALLMASYHVAGKIKWDAHEKAGHIWHMINVLHIPESELTSTLHMGAPAIKRAAESYGMLEHYKKIDGGKYAGDAAGKWSFFDGMLKIKDFRLRTKAGQEFLDDFCRWVGDKRIPNSIDVRDLQKILTNKRSRDIFHSEPAEEAFAKAKRSIDAANPGRNSKFFAHLEKMISVGRDASLSDLDTASGTEVGRDTVIEAYQVLTAFMEKSGVRAPGPRRVA